MQYFTHFPVIPYKFNLGGIDTLITVKDIALNVRVIKYILENSTLYDEYDIEDGETPDSIQYRLYGKHEYHWIIMLLNQIYDVERDFPLSVVDLSTYISIKYGEDNHYAQHLLEDGTPHFEDRYGAIQTKLSIDQFVVKFPSITPETQTELELRYNNFYADFVAIQNFEYEDRINESKRRIKVMTKSMVERTAAELSALINYGR